MKEEEESKGKKQEQRKMKEKEERKEEEKNRHSPTLLKRSELIHSHIMLIVMDNIYISESKKRKIRLPDDAVISSKRPTRSNTTVPGFRVTLCLTGNILDDDVYRTVIMNYKLRSCCSLLELNICDVHDGHTINGGMNYLYLWAHCVC